MSPLCATTVFALAVLARLSSSQLIIAEAGRSTRQGPTLTDGALFCPEDFSASGFSIRCVHTEASKYANFYINDVKVKRDKTKPFYMFGNRKNGKIRKWSDWKNFAGVVTIKCKQSDGTVTEARFTLSCSSTDDPVSPPGMLPPPMPKAEEDPPVDQTTDRGSLSPGTLLFHPTGAVDQPGVVISDGETFCPASLNSDQFSVMCASSSKSTNAKFFVDGAPIKTERTKPYFIMGDGKDGRVRPWKTYPTDRPFELGCRLSDGTSSTVTVTIACDNEPQGTDEPMTTDENDGGGMETGSGCVVIDARATTLSEDWEETAHGVVFRSHVTGTYVAKPGIFPLTYLFTATVTSQHAFVVDMTTMGGSEHNDIYAMFPGGFQLMRHSVVHEDERKGNGFMKVYHNERGRAAFSSSVDNNPHSIATRNELEAGVEYEVVLAGRSSMVEVHRIIMFPCEGTECQRGSRVWQTRLAECTKL